ncbi:MAG: DUF1232 domain-containing protein [Scytolyngbya sp. HA4215-MV1]|nr:DUF1232 domain-containing protein [Scytolyngbya sp. HA4215-MV1]
MNFSVQSIYNWYRTTLRNPKYRWWIIIGSLAYLLSPIDISPDFIPIFGWIDDGILITLLATEVSQLLIERVKFRKPDTATDPAPATDETVEVDAISVK